MQQAARQRMIDIARRAEQSTTKRQNFQQLVANEKRLRRGGRIGDVEGPGKRKNVNPDTQASRRRPRIYDRSTRTYDIDD